MKIRTKILLFLIIVFSLQATDIVSQVTQEWIARYNYIDADWAIDMAVDINDNIYVLGISSGVDWDYATVKYNSNGVQQWSARYNGVGNYTDYAYAIAVNNSGEVFVTGWSYFGTGTGEDWATVKYNSAGAEQWVARYNGTANLGDASFDIAVDQLNNIYVTGSTQNIIGNRDFCTIKYNNEGIHQWISFYNGPSNGYDVAVSVGYDINGNVFVTGASEGNQNDYAVIKYNPNGVQQWAVRYDGPVHENDNPSSLYVDHFGNIIVTGTGRGANTSSDYVTVKYNNAGLLQWAARYNGTLNNEDFASKVLADNLGNVYVTGRSKGIGSGYDYLTVKYSVYGLQQWAVRYNGPENGNDEAYSMAIDESNNIYVTGRSLGSGTDYDYATVKYNSSGNLLWVQRYNDSSNSFDQANSVVVDSKGCVYVTGNERNGMEDDFATVKYSQTIGIQIISSEIPEQYILTQNYPNPFNPVTNIEFSIPKTGFVMLEIFDVLGRKAETLVNAELKPGTYKVDWTASNYPSGIYFYRLSAGPFSESRKMILVK